MSAGAAMGGGSGTGCGPAGLWADTAVVKAMEIAVKSAAMVRRRKNEYGTPILQNPDNTVQPIAHR